MDREMSFELTIRLFLGEKAYHIADQEGNEKYRKEWLQKVGKVIIKRVDQLDTTTRHQRVLAAEAGRFFNAVKSRALSPWGLIYILLRLCGRLLGFDFVRGSILHTPTYYQTNHQYYTTHVLEGGDPMQDYYDRKDAISVRQKLAGQLKNEGLTDFKIALVLNTTEYQVKKLKKGL